MEEFRKIWGSEVVDNLEGKKFLLIYRIADGKPMQLLENRCAVMGGVRVMVQAAEFWTICSL